VGALAAVVLLYMGWKTYNYFFPTIYTGKPQVKSVATLNADELLKEYADNPQQANAKYAENSVTLTGTIEKLRPGACVFRRAGAAENLPPAWAIGCVFQEPKDREGLEEGEEITVQGTVEPRTDTDAIVLNPCWLVSKGTKIVKQ
jgi:hypothetical protein